MKLRQYVIELHQYCTESKPGCNKVKKKKNRGDDNFWKSFLYHIFIYVKKKKKWYQIHDMNWDMFWILGKLELERVISLEEQLSLNVK